MATRLTTDSFRNAFRIVAKKVKEGQATVLLGVPDTTHPSGLPMPVLMAYHEYGTKTIPARAPFVKTMRKNRKRYVEGLEKAAAIVVKSRSNIGYERLGATAVSDVQQTIQEGLSPKLKSSTIAAKGSSKPLIDHGTLIQSISYEVVD